MRVSRCLITGGAGFIGSNLADYWLERSVDVVLYDNLSRAGAIKNLHWLKEKYGERVTFIRGDVRLEDVSFARVVEEVDAVFHLAAQVAVTTSVTHPRMDFDINANGTFNVLEAIRASSRRPALLYSSTNKVYGRMEDVAIGTENGRYVYSECRGGIPESRPLDFYSPYGCSKGAGDQYVRDYARIYGLQTVVFRQSCIYGPRQFGIEDQGWVAWFAMRGLAGLPITIYGDGRQVRDVLFIEDLLHAYAAAVENISQAAGQVFNIGGGPEKTLSLLELIHHLENRLGQQIERSFDDWRPGDQLVYVSDIGKASELLGWTPKIGVEEGLDRLLDWLITHRHLFMDQAAAHA